MNTYYSQTIQDFLWETEPLIERLDHLTEETLLELYGLYGAAAKSASLKISQIDPELRVALCEKQDQILDRIIDVHLVDLKSKNIKGVYTPAIQGFRRWKNVELFKDTGLTGYLLSNVLNTNSFMMFGSKPTDYSYTNLLPRLQMLYSNDNELSDPTLYFRHMAKDYTSMDVLVLHGMYNATKEYLNTYRRLRPDGKVYCGLDMNSHWMERINWKSAEVKKFSEQCDLIATSCRSLRDALNRNPNVSFPCRWIPYGFFNATGKVITTDARVKKNIILTVARIGTDQKNNEEMLLAFEKAHYILTGWTLRLVGTIDPKFEPFIDQYFKKFPHMRDKVIFTGSIIDKNELYKEYAQAKIFALTSLVEGGTPNVYAEALVHGCMFVTSNIDGADDITNFGELGLKYKLGDINELADALVKVAANGEKDDLQNHISKALSYAHKYYDWNRNAKKLAYMLYN